MWPFTKKPTVKTPWDDLVDYLHSDDITFDLEKSKSDEIYIKFNDKELVLNASMNWNGDFSGYLMFGITHLNPFMGKRAYKACKNTFMKYRSVCNKQVENKLYCDLFNKCNES